MGAMTSGRRALLVALAAGAGLTWAAGGWPLWPLAWGLGALLVAALPAVRHVAGDTWGLPAALLLIWWRSAAVIEYPSLICLTTCAGIAAGAGALRPWRLNGWQRATVLLALALAVPGMTIAAIIWGTGAADRAAAKQASWQAQHERWLWDAPLPSSWLLIKEPWSPGPA